MEQCCKNSVNQIKQNLSQKNAQFLFLVYGDEFVWCLIAHLFIYLAIIFQKAQ